MDDGLLDEMIYKNFSKLEYLRHAIAISQGRRPLGEEDDPPARQIHER